MPAFKRMPSPANALRAEVPRETFLLDSRRLPCEIEKRKRYKGSTTYSRNRHHASDKNQPRLQPQQKTRGVLFFALPWSVNPQRVHHAAMFNMPCCCYNAPPKHWQVLLEGLLQRQQEHGRRTWRHAWVRCWLHQRLRGRHHVSRCCYCYGCSWLWLFLLLLLLCGRIHKAKNRSS